MGFVVPQVITESKASGAQFIGNTLQFDDTAKHHLIRTFSGGNRQTFTWSGWVKRDKFGGYQTLFGHVSGGSGQHYIDFGSDRIRFTRYVSANEAALETTAKYRDTGWLHIVAVWDTTNSTENDRQRLYVNGEQITSFSTRVNPAKGYEGVINTAIDHGICRIPSLDQNYSACKMTQVYFLDGIALGPEYFGYTDPLTNTWKPKKYEGEFNGAAVAGTTYANADVTHFYNASNDGQTLGSGYISGATSNAILIIPGYNRSEEGSSNSISSEGATTVSQSKWYGNSIQFGQSASQGNVEQCLSYSSALGLSGADYFTMEAWVYPRSGSNGYNIIFEGDWQSNHGILFQLTSDRKPRLWFGNGGFQTFTSSLPAPADTWSHVAVVCDNNTIRFFVNGTMDVQGTRTTDYTVGNGYRFIGAYRDSNHYSGPRSPFYGYMQDIRVTSDARYTSDFTVPGSGEVDAGVNGFYLPLDGESPIGQDKSGNGNDWKAANFGPSREVDHPLISGARPILNTTQGGARAGLGVFGSKENIGYAVTVAPKTGGGNAYYIDGVEAPSLTGLIRGATYTFDTSDSTVASHPFRLATAADAAGSTQYTNGVVAVTGTATTITIPHNAPDTLYYYCTAHSGMGNNITGITTNEKLADKYASNCVIALPMVGHYYDVSQQLNPSTNRKIFTGEIGVDTTDWRGNFYSGSANFSGSNSYLQTPAGSDFAYGTDDFTIEAWIYSTNTSNNTIYTQTVSGTNYLVFVYNNGNTVSFLSSGGNVTTAGTIPRDRWNHVAVVRKSGTVSIYLNGNKDTNTGGNTYDFTNTSYAPTLGTYSHSIGTENFTGNIQDFRIYKGIAKYDGNFIVPSTAPDIVKETPTITSPSKLAKVTGGAMSFDGTNDVLDGGISSDYELSDEHTIEAWIYSRNTQDVICANYYYTSGDAEHGWHFGFKGSHNRLNFRNAHTNTEISTNGLFAKNRWYHVAVVTTGGTSQIYVNGKPDGASGDIGTPTTTNTRFTVGGLIFASEPTGYSNHFNGFISNLRVVKGTALYSGQFTPPSGPLTNVTNTKLLALQDNRTFRNGGVPILNTTDDGSTATSGTKTDAFAPYLVLAVPMNGSNGGTTFTDYHHTVKGSGSAKTVSVNGNTQTSTAESVYYGSSALFDGTGDNLTIPASGDFDFGTGAYCIEMWIKTIGSPDAGWLFYDAGSSNQGLRICIGNNGTNSGNKGKIQFNEQVSNGDDPQNGTTHVSDNRWHHIAVCRGASGDSTQLFVDGKLEVTGSANRNFDNNNTVYIGMRSDGSGDAFNGYIQGLRVYKGVKKYYGNFDITSPLVSPITQVAPNSLSPAINPQANNFNPFITDINAVRGQETGYNTFSPLLNRGNNTLSDGNTFVTGGSNWNTTLCTGVIESGKWYVELTHKGRQSASDNDIQFGLFGLNDPEDGYPLASTKDLAAQSTGYVIVDANAKWYNNSSSTSYGTTWSTPGDVVGLRYNADTGKLGFIINGVDQGDISTTLSTSQRWVVGVSLRGGGAKAGINFGQNPFKFPPPEGYQSLNLSNLRPDKVFARPDQYVGIVTYTGNGGTKQVDGLVMKPDLVWVKSRSTTAAPVLGDSVRGFGETKMLSPTVTAEEDRSTDPTDGSERGYISSNHDRGFTVVDGSGASQANGDGTNYVAWCWKAGGYKNSFNVDDVGYATAAEIGMSVGAHNSTHFDQSATWSNSLTASNGFISASYDATKAFNGFTSGNHSGSNSNGILTWSPNLTIPANSIIEIFAGSAETAYMDVTVNGVPNTSTPGGRFVQVNYDGSTTLSTLTVYRTGGGNSADIRGIRINGKLLVDSGVTVNAPSIVPSACSIGTKQGFSIIKYTGNATQGARVPHGLNSPIDFMITKRTDDVSGWAVGSSALENWEKVLYLSDTAGQYTQQEPFNGIQPTDKVFELYDSSASNANGGSYIAYCWHNVPGLQKFGKFLGNGDSNGPFIELGFRARLVWVKRVDTTEQWYINDTERDTFNRTGKSLRIQSAEGEASTGGSNSATWDILSNGIKMRDTGAGSNNSSGTYLYAAWAEVPTVSLFNTTANAR